MKNKTKLWIGSGMIGAGGVTGTSIYTLYIVPLKKELDTLNKQIKTEAQIRQIISDVVHGADNVINTRIDGIDAKTKVLIYNTLIELGLINTTHAPKIYK